ncbi:hypothetical protein ILUMI_08889 [Ignelater luminosus]|uniref:Uncharacterized protein n=1 Tax=Ignelater luminosus TaxID=2038154 RepID=A0A8K0GA77_IGNLU|nr:hypothetical protein ILUMI_08889 [Ignelater luminosus]
MTEPDMDLYEDLLNLRNIPALDKLSPSTRANSFSPLMAHRTISGRKQSSHHHRMKTPPTPPPERKSPRRGRGASVAPTISDEVSAGVDAAAPGPSHSAPTVSSTTPPPASPTPSYSEVLQRPGSAMSYASDAFQPAIKESCDTDGKDGLGKQLQADDNLYLPLLEELGIFSNIHMRVIDWHLNFDALIGTEDFRRLGAKIDYATNTLEISGVSIPFFLEYSSRQITQAKVTPSKFLKGPVSIAQDCYYNVPAKRTVPTEVNFSKRIQVVLLSNEEITEPSQEVINSLNITNAVNTGHLNVEEREKLIELCSKFKDVFCNENCDLSFANAVKHEIRTKDDQPVHVRQKFFTRRPDKNVS